MLLRTANIWRAPNPTPCFVTVCKPPSISARRPQSPQLSSMKAKSRGDTLKSDVWNYQYQALDPSQDSIRLLRLTCSDHSPWTLRGTLFHTQLSNAPPYVALSYTWGERTGFRHVLIDGGVVPVTPNLEQALKRLRPKTGEGPVLWIDAICINQADIKERSVQTGKMRTIYQNAESVAVWLGLENPGNRNALQLVHDLTVTARGTWGSIIREPSRFKQLEDLVVLFRRQYWWRIWVIQEVSSAKDVMVYCGPLSIPWNELVQVCSMFKEEEDFLRDLFYESPSRGRTLTHGGPRSLLLSRYSPDLESPPLLELLLSHKSKKSTDPKDKVFALVGISSSRYTFGPIDYAASLRDTYTRTIRHIISTSRRLDVICVKQNDTVQHDLPSWVPDWTRPPPSYGSLPVGLHHHEPAFTAAGDSLAEYEFMGDGYVLNATGFRIDTIIAVGRSFRAKGAPKNIEPALVAFHDWWDIYVKHVPDPYSLASQAAFGRAISCGNWNFDEEGIYEEKLKALSALPYNSLSSSMTSSIGSLADEGEYFDEDVRGKEGIAVMINASITMNRRRLFVSKSGLVGIAQLDTTKGDFIAILYGCRFPVILRHDDVRYKLVGEAYVEGFMDGEGMAALEEGRFHLENFQIT